MGPTTYHRAKKRAVALHELGAWGSKNFDRINPLFFVTDKKTGVKFLVDTGASKSLFPLNYVDDRNVQPSTLTSLKALGSGVIDVLGVYKTQINLGFSHLFEHEFYISNILYGILGADFLAYHKLIVDISARRLTESIEVEQCYRYGDSDFKNIFAVQSGDKTDSIILTELKNEYPEVFDAALRERCCKHSVVASIETSSEEPISCKARRLSPEKFRALGEELKRLCDQGILEKSQSAWSSPIVMVRKKSGGWRLCADLTNLNKVLKPKKYALPHVSDFTSLAHGCNLFSSIDIADAYYNIRVRPEDRHKLTITTPLGNYQYNFLPMGLASSSTYFQLLMNEVLSGLPHVFCYLDDVIVMSKTHLEHRQTLKAVFSRLREHGLVVNAKKCNLGVKELSFLGFHVSSEGLKPLQLKVETINNFVTPTTTKLLKSYLGMYQYYARFIKGSTKFLQPLYDLVNSAASSRRLIWSTESLQCFQDSKEALASATALAFPDPHAQTELIVDASGSSIGATLQQEKDGECRPIAFWSKALNKSQKSWSTFERELYACYAAIKHFSYFLEGSDFILKTDHRPIVNKFHSHTLAQSPRQQRYFDFIAQMTNRVEHIPGAENPADILSRIPHEEQPLSAIVPDEPSLDYLRIALMQKLDPEIELLRGGQSEKAASLQPIEVRLADHDVSLLCDQAYSRLRPIIPQGLRYDVFKLYHSWSHPGAQTGIKLISSRFVWNGMKRDIRQWTRECQACARAKIQRHNVAPLDNVTPTPKDRFTNVYVDITGPLGESNGYNYLLVVIDRFSRFMNAIPLAGITAEECVDAFIRHWVVWFGCPEHIYTDRGTQFTSVTWLNMCHYLGSQAHQSTAYHPQAQGLVERLNRTLKSSLKCYDNPTDWHDHLPWVLMALRNSPKEDLKGFTPNDFVLGQPIRLPGEFFDENTDTDIPCDPDSIVTKFGHYVTSLRFMPPRKNKRKSYLEKALFLPETTHVYVRNDSHRHPLQPTYQGPYKIISKNPKYFELDLRRGIDKVSIDRLKSATLSFKNLNLHIDSADDNFYSLASSSPKEKTPNDLCAGDPDDIFNESAVPPIVTSKGRITQRPLKFRDYYVDF